MIIGSRNSALAMAQTRKVVEMMAVRSPDLAIEVLEVRTEGDRVTDRPLASLGGVGAFTKELDQRIVAGEIDVAVNSLKDMPVDMTPGTTLAAVLPRGPVEDVLLSSVPLDALPLGAVVGSSSVRRRSMLLAKRPDLIVKDLRGNVPTRIRKWKEGGYDAIVLARAGMVRLGIEEQCYLLDPAEFIPAPGQGAIAIVCASGSPYFHDLRQLDDLRTRTEVEAERAILKALGGGCSVPIGAWAVKEGGSLRIRAVVVGDKGELSVDRVVSLDDVGKVVDEIADTLRSAMKVCANAR